MTRYLTRRMGYALVTILALPKVALAVGLFAMTDSATFGMDPATGAYAELSPIGTNAYDGALAYVELPRFSGHMTV